MFRGSCNLQRQDWQSLTAAPMIFMKSNPSNPSRKGPVMNRSESVILGILAGVFFLAIENAAPAGAAVLIVLDGWQTVDTFEGIGA